MTVILNNCPSPVAANVRQLGRDYSAPDLLSASRLILQHYVEGAMSEGPAWLDEAGSMHLAMALCVQHESAVYIRKHYPGASLDRWDLVEQAMELLAQTNSSANELSKAIRARCNLSEAANQAVALHDDFSMFDWFDLSAFDWAGPLPAGVVPAG